MVEGDKFHAYERLAAMFEMHGKPPPTSRSNELYWEALKTIGRDDFDRAIDRACQQLKWPARPSEIRDFARDSRRDRELKADAEQTFRCHAHGDGRWEPGGEGKPNEPSRNPTMRWCDRCVHFARLGMQAPDTRPPHVVPVFKRRRVGEPESVGDLANGFLARLSRIQQSESVTREPGEDWE